MRFVRALAYLVWCALLASCEGETGEAADAGPGLGKYWGNDGGGSDGVDAGLFTHDAGSITIDAGLTDAGSADAGAFDAGSGGVDAGRVDAGGLDAGGIDAGMVQLPDGGAPRITSFTGSPTNVVAGSPATLQWVLAGGAPATLTIGTTSVLGSNSSQVVPSAASTQYTLTATNVAGSASATVTIEVGAKTSPAIDARKLPASAPGWSTKRIEPTTMSIGTGDPDGVGAFRLGCYFAKMSFDDPLFFPRQPGAAPLLTYFGNVGVTASSTDQSIQNTGNSTCSGGILNRTAYSIPAMIDTTDGTPVPPTSVLVYYKTGYGGVKASDVKAVPVGLRMIGGNPKGQSADTASGGRFACVGGDLGVGWQTTLPTNCYQNNAMIFEVSFPQCWDGLNLDSPDHRSHMADTTGTGCPATHHVALPEITYEIYYDLANVDLARMAKWRLSTDLYDASLPAGYSAHGEYIYGWDKATMQTFITNCDNPGADCHANLLGDGTWLY